MVLTSRKAVTVLDAPDASSSSSPARPEPCPSSSSPSECHRAAMRSRPAMTPAYYLGRPAWFWLEHFRRSARVLPRALKAAAVAPPGSPLS